MNDKLTPLNELANLIRIECSSKAWFAYAKPYVDAMAVLTTAKENYYEDSGVSVCLYALGNLSSWRGGTAQNVKAQIKRHVELALA